MTEVLAAMKANDYQIRAAALEAAAAAPGPEATKVCLEALDKAATPFERINLVTMLGNRHDPAALPAILRTLKDSDEGVRMSAGQAIAMIGGTEASAALIDQISATSGRDRDIAVSAFSRMPGTQPNAAAAAALAKAPDAGVRVALVNALAARRAASSSRRCRWP
jgi:HEAT repeat protein